MLKRTFLSGHQSFWAWLKYKLWLRRKWKKQAAKSMTGWD